MDHSVNYQPLACMYVPLYLSWNKPTCYVKPWLCLNHVKWWQLGLISMEDSCVTLCHLLAEAGRAGLSQTPSRTKTVTSSTCRTSVLTLWGGLWIRESTAVDSGNSDTRSIQVVSFHSKVLFASCQWLLELWPWLIVLVDIWWEKHSCGRKSQAI